RPSPTPAYAQGSRWCGGSRHRATPGIGGPGAGRGGCRDHAGPPPVAGWARAPPAGANLRRPRAPARRGWGVGPGRGGPGGGRAGRAGEQGVTPPHGEVADEVADSLGVIAQVGGDARRRPTGIGEGDHLEAVAHLGGEVGTPKGTESGAGEVVELDTDHAQL